jgi:hypothetical protein
MKIADHKYCVEKLVTELEGALSRLGALEKVTVLNLIMLVIIALGLLIESLLR